jgi:hypothetical protein
MQDFDSFISPIPRFEGDVLIPAIPISTRDPSAESSKEPLAGSSASTPRTQACNRKAPVDSNPPKKAKKMARKPLGGIKITGPKQKALVSTPPSGTRKGIPILRSKRYIHHKFFLLSFVTNPQTSMQGASRYPFNLSCKGLSTRE